MKQNNEQKWVYDNFGEDYNTLFKNYSTPMSSIPVDRQAIEICVVATSSQSSANFINAMLHQTVLPTLDNTTSPFVNKIYNGNNNHFIAEIYDSEERLVAENFDCNSDSLIKLYAMEGIHSIRTIGKIPCFTGLSITISLADVPMQNLGNYLKKAKDNLVLCLISGEFNVLERNLLEEVQQNLLDPSHSKNQIYFVLDSLDKQEVGSMPLLLTEIKEKLNEIGFTSPKLFPTSSVTSLLLKESVSNDKGKENSCQVISEVTQKINSNKEYHFEDFLLGTLTSEYLAQLKLAINEVKDSYGGEQYSNLQEAIYHTGLPAVELGMLAFIDKQGAKRKGLDGKMPSKPPFDRKKKKNASLYKNPMFDYITGDSTEVCFFSLESVGKSTLVNALLKQELVPLSHEISVEIVSKVKHETNWGGLKSDFSGIFYDCANIPQEKLNYVINSHLSLITKEKKIQLVALEGKIPFTSSPSQQLTLIDVPTSDTPDIIRLQNQLLEKNSKTLAVFMISDTIGSEEQTFLKRVSQSIEIGGKQTKDRFIFVVNHLEGKTESEIAEYMERVCSYLNEIGIQEPTIVATSGKVALEFSCMEYRRKKLGVDTSETEALIVETNKTKGMHLEEFAMLSKNLKEQVALQLETAKAIYMGEDGLGLDHKNITEARIHTGVTVLELAINEYLKKYGG